MTLWERLRALAEVLDEANEGLPPTRIFVGVVADELRVIADRGELDEIRLQEWLR